MKNDPGSLTSQEYLEICNTLKVHVNILHQEGEPSYMRDIREAEIGRLRVIIKKMEARMEKFPNDWV